MDRRVTPTKRVISHAWGPTPPKKEPKTITNACELALELELHIRILFIYQQLLFLFPLQSQAWPRNSHEYTPNPVP